ncbi:translocase of chloroplast 90, chloroplastic isoform X1 [Cinnamomum micranthum f. kanehirae]|uniref:Translocase of chloroplast 90, chloroplastic isoform X1 n=1 Tax=Cinnamomum micranthum f. kanehirae TaxID=337451 RepID=A0A3S4PIR2_9MAGN|nr:translocase of chloroplast 90, chloroplastic isoform X1 [Cinnamomum micranthum f. kanehirae]
MEAIKDWISCQLASKSLLSTRPLTRNFFREEPLVDEPGDQGSSTVRATISESAPADASTSISDSQIIENASLSQPVAAEDSQLSHHIMDDKKRDPLAKVEALQINFLRLVRRLGQSSENLVIAQVLYRLQLAILIRAGESGIRRSGLQTDRARSLAAAQESAGQPDLDFSFKILVLGKTGVGKSATINSIFDQIKAATDAFQPATDRIQEVVGTVSGIKVTVIDTPGLLPSCCNQRRNRKILLSVKRHIKRSPPDIVLYFERLDVINMGYNDFPLLKLITDVLGFEIWFNTILVMTHCSSALPEGADGYPVSYDAFVTRCTKLVQHYIQQAVSDTRLENPVLLVENHPLCKTNTKGEKVLPNGQVWRSQFLLLCASSKVLGDANTLLKFKDSFQMSRHTNNRLPSLPHLLSSLLHSRSLFNVNGPENDMDEVFDEDDEEDYNQLPPIRILSKAQFEELSESQKNDYLDELDYRETLYLKKLWKAEQKRRRDKILAEKDSLENDDSHEDAAPEAVLLPDMAVPLCFDSDYPVYRYRCLLGNDRWIVRPVLDSQGWDHDVGFDGINLETSLDINDKLHGSMVGQMSKDKQDFTVQTECAAAYVDQEGPTAYAGIEIQTAGRDLICTVRGDTKLRNMKHNVTGCGFTLSSFGNRYFVGAKVEDSITIGKRLKLIVNTGRMGGLGQVAYGGSVEATLRGKDYPVRDDKTGIVMTFLSYEKETVLGGTIQSDFRPRRSMKMSVSANLNSRRMGQLSLRTSTSEHFEIALIALFPIVRSLFRKRAIDDGLHS